MGTESAYIMTAIGLALAEQTGRIFGSGVYWIKVPRAHRRMKGLLRADAVYEAGLLSDDGSYLEKLVTEYEIIPLMSKLI